MNIQEIMNYLPHRYPFLLVDKVIELEQEKRILATKNVTINEHFFQGHFPTKAVMPGVLIIEAMAQAAGILAYKSTEWQPQSSLFYLGSIEKTKFKKIVVPGDVIYLKVDVTKRKRTVWKFDCQAKVDDQIVCETGMTSIQGTV